MTSQVRLNFADATAISAFSSFKLRETFSDPIGSLEFTAEPDESHVREYAEKLQKGSLVACIVDGNPQAAMAIETVQTSIGPGGGVSFNVSAVTPIKYIYEAEIDPKFQKRLAADIPLLDLVSEVLEPYGLGEVYAEDDVAVIRAKTGKNPKATATATAPLQVSGNVQAATSETVYQFLSRVLTRLGVMLRMDPVGNGVYITAPHYDGEALYGCKVAREGQGPSDLDRFFGNVTIHDSNANQFSVCYVTGTVAGNSGTTFSGPPSAEIKTTDIHSSRPPFRGEGALTYKPAFRHSKNCRDAKQARSAGLLMLGLQAPYAFYVKGTVDGLVSRAGTPWTVDTLGRVFIEPLAFDEEMWLAERTMMADPKGGQRTELVWIPKGYFVIGEA